MIRILETFSGIGSQSKALSNIGVDFEVVNTVEWDITAIYAYDLIHNGLPNISKYLKFNKDELFEMLTKSNLSNGGKRAMTGRALKSISEETLRLILSSIERTNNLVDITSVKASNLDEGINMITYSFPCQDLSIGRAWHGDSGGIERGANTRSGMLWEIERILKEYLEEDKELPRYLLMENVNNIMSKKHIGSFNEWKGFLDSIGYYNKVYTLDASMFGIPQTRTRTFMLSVLTESVVEYDLLDKYFITNSLENYYGQKTELKEFLRIDYKNEEYFKDALISCPNFTDSRKKIFENSEILYDGINYLDTINTITTKQDRFPNSGLITFRSGIQGKSPYRYLTPRECFLLMGFDESDYQILVDNNINLNKRYSMFTREKLIKLAGNSIVVNVLEEIFKQVIDIELLLEKESINSRAV